MADAFPSLHSRASKAAIEAAKQRKYRPALNAEGTAPAVKVTVPLNFKLA